MRGSSTRDPMRDLYDAIDERLLLERLWEAVDENVRQEHRWPSRAA